MRARVSADLFETCNEESFYAKFREQRLVEPSTRVPAETTQRRQQAQRLLRGCPFCTFASDDTRTMSGPPKLEF
jgi:hypothetical protein